MVDSDDELLNSQSVVTSGKWNSLGRETENQIELSRGDLVALVDC